MSPDAAWQAHSAASGSRGPFAMIRDLRFVLLLGCFFVSGLAALIYETTWTRQFSFVFGTTELAVATVLAAYMAGLAGGAAVAGRLGPRVRRPVLAYALLELGIALAALAVPAAISLSNGLYRAIFGGADRLVEAGGLGHSLFYLACSFAILVIPTGFMGATLPLLARHAVRSDAELGSRVGLLYTANTLGAVCGTVLTAFVLLPALGLGGSIRVAIGANVVVFLAGAVLARRAPPVDVGPRVADGEVHLPPQDRRYAWILPVMLLSGAASFTYEVLWTRLLGHVMGGAVYAFATMLAAFLAGIALGAWIASRIATGRGRAARAFAWCQVGIAALSLAAFAAIDLLPGLLQGMSAGGRHPLLADAAAAALILLPSTIFIGATFPLAVRILAPSGTAAMSASARVYAWNTVGAILGAVGSGFFVIPALGYSGTVSLAIAVNLALAAVAGIVLALPRPRAVWAAAAGLIVLAFVRPPQPWNLLRSSPLELEPVEGTVIYYSVGRGATVLMLQNRGSWLLRTNGLPEARIRPPGARQSEQVINWMAALPCLARPEAETMMIVGLGGGSINEVVPASIRAVDTVEIAEEVIEANRAVSAVRRTDPLADPRLTLIVNDARGAMTLSDTRYDLIISQPSHPWTAAASNLYTREFFELARSRLAPGGVLAQWMGIMFIDEALLRTLIATLGSVFQNVRVYWPVPSAVILLASDGPLDVEETSRRALAADPTGYARLGLFSVEDVAAALALDESGAIAFAEGAPLSTDDRNELAMRSPALVRRGRTEFIGGLSESMADHDPLIRPTPGLDREYMVRRIQSNGFRERAARVASFSHDPAVRSVSHAWTARARQVARRAAELLNQAVALDPALSAAWQARALLDRAKLAADGPIEDGARLRDSDLAVIEGWRLESARDWTGLQALEPRLAAAPRLEPLFPAAVRLRAAWRLEAGDPALAAEAIDLLDEGLAVARNDSDLILRAKAALQAGKVLGAVRTLFEAGSSLTPGAAGRRAAREALEVVATLPPGPIDDRELRDLTARFERAMQSPPE